MYYYENTEQQPADNRSVNIFRQHNEPPYSRQTDEAGYLPQEQRHHISRTCSGVQATADRMGGTGMITYTMGINLEYLRIVITIWREYGMLCPIIIPKDQDAEGAVMVKIGPTTDMKVAEMVDKIWDIAGAKRLVKEIEK